MSPVASHWSLVARWSPVAICDLRTVDCDLSISICAGCCGLANANLCRSRADLGLTRGRIRWRRLTLTEGWKMCPKEVDPGAFWATTRKQRNHCFLSHFAIFGVKWARCKITIRPTSKAKSFNLIGFSCIFWKSVRLHVALRCRSDRCKIAKMGPGRTPILLQFL